MCRDQKVTPSGASSLQLVTPMWNKGILRQFIVNRPTDQVITKIGSDHAEVTQIGPESCNPELPASDYLESLRSLWQEPKYHTPAHQAYVMQRACKCGQLEIAKWAWSLGFITNIWHRTDLFMRKACERGHLPIIEWLWSVYWETGAAESNRILSLWQNIFRNACSDGYLGIAQWAIQMQYPWIPGSVTEEYQSCVARRCGRQCSAPIETARVIWALNLDYIISRDQHADMIAACYSNHLAFLEWRWSINPLGEDASDLQLDQWNQLFQISCGTRHPPVIPRWMWSVDPRIDLHVSEDRLFRAVWGEISGAVVAEVLIECSQDDPFIRFARHRDTYYIVGAAHGDHTYCIDGVEISSQREVPEEQVKEVLELTLRKKSARSAIDE